MSNRSTRSSSRALRVPEKLRNSPPKKPVKAKVKATKNQDDPIDYEVETIYTCRCEDIDHALCHFVGYESSEDEWRPLFAMSK